MSNSPFGNLNNLIIPSPEQAYWIGFLLADGTIDSRGRLRLTLSTKDEQHLEAFKKFLGCKTPLGHDIKTRSVSFAMLDTGVVESLSGYGLVPNKTEHPPLSLPFKENTTLLKSMLIGLIDGDGTVVRQHNRPASKIIVTSLYTWTGFYSDLSAALSWGKITHRERGRYCLLSCYKHKENLALKQFTVDHGLPVLSRKWDAVTEFQTSVQQKSEKVENLVRQGLTTSEIVDKLGVARHTVYRARKRIEK